MEQKSRISREQYTLIVDYMERHGDISKPEPRLAERIRCEELWKRLVISLNSDRRGAKRPLQNWRRSWAYWKCSVKKKYLNARRQDDGSGDCLGILTALERRVIQIMRVAAHTEVDDIRDQGFNGLFSSNIQEETGNNFITSVPSSANNAPTSVPGSSQTASSLTRAQAIRRQASASATLNYTTRRTLPQPRRVRRQMASERATSEFAAIERLRLKQQEVQDKRLHEREMERMRIDAMRIDVDREHNQLLNKLCVLGQHLIDLLTQR